MRRLRQAMASIGFAIVAVSCGWSSQPATTYPVYKFSCCLADDLKRTWHPGETVQLHWIVQPATRAPNPTPHAVILSTTLTGPYSDVSTLKKLSPATNRISGSTARANDRTGEPAPVSQIVLPDDLPTGLYNLEFKVDLGGGNWWSGGIVIVVGAG